MSLVVYDSADRTKHFATMKVLELSRDQLNNAVQKAGMQLTDLREITSEYQPRVISSR